MRKWQPKTYYTLAVIGIFCLVFGIAGLWFYAHRSAETAGHGVLPTVGDLVKRLPQRSPNHPTVKLTDTSQPVPTNSWLSGLVFASKQSSVYLYPWTYRPIGRGAELSYPDVQTTAQTITAQHTADLTLDVGSDDYTVSDFDDLSAEINYLSAGETVASARLVQGSPYMFFTLQSHCAATLKAGGNWQRQGDNRYVVRVGDKTYGIWADSHTKLQAKSHNLTLSTSDTAGKFTLITLPPGLDRATAFDLSSHEVTKTQTTYAAQGNQTTTTFALSTADHQPTLFGLLPHQTATTTARHKVGSIKMLLGTENFYKGTTFRYKLDSAMPADTIITRQLSADQKSALVGQLTRDIDSTKFTATDTYGAGKQLYRAANLLELAHELNQPQLAGRIHDKLRTQLDTWFDPTGGNKRPNKYFYYDPSVHGLVGVDPSFGSQQFNDHQFHYGYFIYAASVLGRYDPGFVHRNRTMVTALIRDIDSPDGTQYFPRLRTYDSYAGHSWADGYGDTPDGNNQESSSEAVNAAYAIYLWSQVTQNRKLGDLARWLYQNQVTTATHYWTNIDHSSPVFSGYQPPIVSLVWQGKLDYATFFSDQPAAKLGIQLIPMSPGQAYLGTDKTRVASNLADIHNPTELADYLLMYQALADPQAAAKQLTGFDPTKIDSADSQAYLMAWIYSHQ